MTRIKTFAAVCAMAVACAACAGPRNQIEVGSKDVPVDILLGRQRQALAPPPGSSPVTGFPGFIAPPVPRPEPGAPPAPAPPPQACPLANPLDASKFAAFKAAPKPPALATYTYRNHGTLKIGAGAETSYPPEETHTIASRKPDGAGNFDFDVAVLLAGETTTTTYRVLNAGQTPDRGIYIAQTVTKHADGTTEAFTPDQPILLLPFPPPEYGTNLEDEIDRQRGQGYQSSGTDPLSQTTMVLEAKIDGKDRVNACGEWVDAFDVEVTTGKIAGPTKNVDFTGHYEIAPQYGGLVVESTLKFSGTDNLEPFESNNRSTINAVPREAG